MADQAPLHGQVALVTGASRGIGRATAIELGRLGAQVFVNYVRDEEAAHSAVAEVEKAGGPTPKALQGNVGRSEEASKLVESVLTESGAIDILVNNAGIQASSMLHRMTDEDWHRVLDVNLSGVFYTSRAALKWMREARRGAIVNVASASAFLAHPGAAGYIASKHGLIGLTKAMALENASRGIRVNVVAPGLTETDMAAGLGPEERDHLLKKVPIGRAASPEEVARMIAFVLTSATYSTGNTFHTSGGVTMG